LGLNHIEFFLLVAPAPQKIDAACCVPNHIVNICLQCKSYMSPIISATPEAEQITCVAVTASSDANPATHTIPTACVAELASHEAVTATLVIYSACC
jgi:hypothetical protein